MIRMAYISSNPFSEEASGFSYTTMSAMPTLTGSPQPVAYYAPRNFVSPNALHNYPSPSIKTEPCGGIATPPSSFSTATNSPFSTTNLASSGLQLRMDPSFTNDAWDSPLEGLHRQDTIFLPNRDERGHYFVPDGTTIKSLTNSPITPQPSTYNHSASGSEVNSYLPTRTARSPSHYQDSTLHHSYTHPRATSQANNSSPRSMLNHTLGNLTIASAEQGFPSVKHEHERADAPEEQGYLFLPQSKARDEEVINRERRQQPCRRRHRQRAASGISWTCELCNKAFPRKFNLDVHRKTHDPQRMRPFQCNECDRGFFRPTDLRRHDLCVHKKSKAFMCSECYAGFPRKDSLKRHKVDGCPYRTAIKPRPRNAISPYRHDFPHLQDRPSHLATLHPPSSPALYEHTAFATESCSETFHTQRRKDADGRSPSSSANIPISASRAETEGPALCLTDWFPCCDTIHTEPLNNSPRPSLSSQNDANMH